MPTSILAPLRRARDRRLVAAMATIVAAAAGVLIGSSAGQPNDGPVIGGLLLVIAACATTAWAAAMPATDVLTASGFDAFRAELDRARRHRRTFAMARLELAGPVDRPAGRSPRSGIEQATVGLVGASLRITDRAWIEDGDVIILLPESDRLIAEAFAERVRASAPDRFTNRAGFAVFPDDGLTSGALLDALERGVRGDARPAPLVPTTIAGVLPGGADIASISTESDVG